MKLKNAKDWKTTTTALIGGLIVIAGIVWPDKVNTETGEVLKQATSEIIVGVGALVTAISGIFGKDK